MRASRAEFLHVFDCILVTLKSVLPEVTNHLLKKFERKMWLKGCESETVCV